MISDVETSLRGFSFMSEIKMKEIDLQYVEDSELERAWRSSRRERLKQQEQKIWEEFLKEQDIVRSVCESDPYQFIDQIPETCLKELLDKELNKMRDKEVEYEVKEEELREIASTPPESPLVTDNVEMEQREVQHVLHIFYDDNDNEELSVHEDDALNDSSASPLCTVREKQEEKEEVKSPDPNESPDIASMKSSANATSIIENGVHCAKVKELRTRINEELLSIIDSVQTLNVTNIDPEELAKIQKRSAEFCSRFSRIHLYQLQRQVEDIKRNNSAASLPFAKHTQFQSQMLRVVSLHQNMLQAFCVLRKSVQQTQCLADCVALCASIAHLLRAAPAPLQSTRDLYNDDLLVTCDRLEETLGKHGAAAAEFIKSIENDNNPYAKKSDKSSGKKKVGPWSKSGSKSTSRADGKLSMYSLDTLRINLKGKSPSTKNIQSSGTSKMSGKANTAEKRSSTKQATPKSKKKAPVARRGGAEDVRTLVQAVQCVSSHVSLEAGSHQSAKTKDLTYRSKEVSSRGRSKEPTPRQKFPESSRRNHKSQNTSNISACGQVNPKIEKENIETSKSSREKSFNVTQDGAESRWSEKEKKKLQESGAASCEVTRLLRELCGGDAKGNKSERISGARNAQLHCISSGSPRQPTTPQLLRILEETIQKKSPRQINPEPLSVKDAEKFRMAFNISERTVENLFQYRTKFVQHMLESSMYANSAVEKPWEMVNRVSEQIIDELLLVCAKEMELPQVLQQLFKCETQ